MSFTQLHYANVSPTTLTSSITASTTPLPVTSVTWPLTTPFEIVIDRGNLNQEACLVTGSPTATSFPVTRNYDGQSGPAVGTGVGHNNGATVEMSATSLDLANFNLHATGISRDDHTNLMRSDGTRHNSAARHLMGISLPGGPPLSSSPGDTQADGNGASLAYADHIHHRPDTYNTYLNYMIRPGIVFPASLSFSDARFVPANGMWYNQADYPLLSVFLGQLHSPLTPSANATTPYNSLAHFAVPAMGTWDSLFQTFTWFLGIQWVVMAHF